MAENGASNDPGKSFVSSDEGRQSSGIGEDGTIDPAAARAASGDGGSEPRKRRGRPPGSGGTPGTKKAQATVSVAGIEKILYSAHQILARAVAPELELDPKEANLLAEGIANVARHYPATIDPKTMAWINLAMVGVSVYAPRVIAMNVRLNIQKQQEKIKPKPSHLSPVAGVSNLEDHFRQ